MSRRHDRVGGPLSRFDDWRSRSREWLTSSPIWFQVLGGAAVLAIVGGVVYGLVVGNDATRPQVAVDTGSTTGPAGSIPTTTVVSTTAVRPTTTVTSTTAASPTTTGPARTTTTAPRPATTTTRRPAATTPPTTPPTTRARFGTFCGYAPGATIEIELNGRSIGSRVANAAGCITVDP